MENYKEEAREIIANNIYMVIATASPSGEPWISPVFFAYDDEYNLYWTSDKNSQHSNLIRKNSKVAIVVFDSRAPEGEGDGVYFEAQAVELNGAQEVERAMPILAARVMKDELRIKKIEDVTKNRAWRIYKATPQKISKLKEGEYVNGQYVDRRIEIDLK